MEGGQTRVRGPQFFQQVHALRAIAVVMVLLYHLWPTHFRGGFIGVDVFLVLSGFLITGQILRQRDRGFRLLPEFWLRRILRLAPAALAVVGAVGLLTWQFVPKELWGRYAAEALASIGISENVLLYSQSVDYLGSENSPTPFQHYWSLSVEEQFYLVWPLLIVLLTIACASLTRRRANRVLLACIALLSVCSFSASLFVLEDSPSAAYFVMPLRLWEFGVGGILALLLPALTTLRAGTALRLGARVSLVGAYAALLVYGWRLPADVAFPGWYGLLAVVLVAVVIVAHPVADLADSAIISRIEQSAPVRFVADISYSAYLWHWPLIILGPFILQRNVTLPWKVTILALTVLLAWGVTRWIEPPLRLSGERGRRLSRAQAVAVIVSAAALIAGGWGAMWVYSSTQQAQGAAQELSEPCAGVKALLDERGCGADPHGETPPLSDIAAAENDRPVAWTEECVATIESDDDVFCTFRSGADDAKAIVLWGDSHAGAWSSAFKAAADRLGVDLYVFSRDGCPPSEVSPVATRYRDIDAVEQAHCRARNQQVVDFIDSHPEVVGVFAANLSVNYSFPEEAPFGGIADALSGLSEPGRAAVLVGDVPLTGDSGTVDIPECLKEHPDDPSSCDNPRDQAQDNHAQRDFVQASDDSGIRLLDTADAFCDDRTCYGMIGGVPVYFDSGHLSGTYSLSLGDWLAERIEPVLPSR